MPVIGVVLVLLAAESPGKALHVSPLATWYEASAQTCRPRKVLARPCNRSPTAFLWRTCSKGARPSVPIRENTTNLTKHDDLNSTRVMEWQGGMGWPAHACARTRCVCMIMYTHASVTGGLHVRHVPVPMHTHEHVCVYSHVHAHVCVCSRSHVYMCVFRRMSST